MSRYETYGDSTVLVGCARGWGTAGEEDSEAELLFYHRLVSKLDRAILPLAGTVWKVQRYTMPYYCVVCPCVNSDDHANVVVDVAFRLHAAAGKVRAEAHKQQMHGSVLLCTCLWCSDSEGAQGASSRCWMPYLNDKRAALLHKEKGVASQRSCSQL